MLYLADLPEITHVVVGISKEQQAYETFKILEQKLKSNVLKTV